MTALTDESLLAGMASGEQSAAAGLVRRYRTRVYGLALTIVRDPVLAEDVAQDAFVKAWRHAATYDPRRGTVATWLLTITRNAAIDAVRYRHEQPMDADVLLAILTKGEAQDDDADPDTSLWLRQALAELPTEQATPIVMMTYYGMTAKEIAARSDLPVGTVKTRVRRGLHALRGRLKVRDG